MKLMDIIRDLRDSFILTIIFFACIFISPCKKISDEEIEKIIKRWFNERKNN